VDITRVSDEPINIQSPFLSFIGTLQNFILQILARGDRKHNGFMDRILFVKPLNLEKKPWKDSKLNQTLVANWGVIINKLVGLKLDFGPDGEPQPGVISFSTEAKAILFEWEKTNCIESNLAADDGISGIFSKIEVYAIRFSLILQLARWACDEDDDSQIGVQAVEGALKLCEYFKRTAIEVHDIVSNYDPIAAHPQIKQDIYKDLADLFTTAEGLRIADRHGMPVRTFMKFLKEMTLFNRKGHGKYEKRC
jgi:hypothetical protein